MDGRNLFATFKIPECKGSRYVIPDIHGCDKTFDALLTKIGLKKEDQLFLLGDYIDRGTGSVEVVDRQIHLLDAGYQLFPIRGNHEEEILLIHELQLGHHFKNRIQFGNIQGFYDDCFVLKEKYYNFFSSMPYYLEFNDFYLVHAGFDFSKPEPFEDFEAMIEIRSWTYNSVLAKEKTIVHGHSPHTLSEVKSNLEKKSKILPIDNGCFYKDDEGMGNLLCLNLDNYQLTIQPNID